MNPRGDDRSGLYDGGSGRGKVRGGSIHLSDHPICRPTLALGVSLLDRVELFNADDMSLPWRTLVAQT